jgi:hypothetical protein
VNVSVTIEHDTITQAMTRLGDAADAVLRDVARDTADKLKAEMQARLRRQTSGTGKTADAVTVETTEDGYAKVTSGEMGSRPANLPIWLEFGTKHMTARPYFYGSIRLEQGAHLRRVEDALQQAIDGLGD